MMKIVVQQIAAVASATVSAVNTPMTPIKCGRISASGISKKTLRKSAMNIEIFASSTATNVF